MALTNWTANRSTAESIDVPSLPIGAALRMTDGIVARGNAVSRLGR